MVTPVLEFDVFIAFLEAVINLTERGCGFCGEEEGQEQTVPKHNPVDDREGKGHFASREEHYHQNNGEYKERNKEYDV